MATSSVMDGRQWNHVGRVRDLIQFFSMASVDESHKQYFDSCRKTLPESDQTMNTVGPRPAVCSWSQNGVVVKEAKSGAVKSYTSDGSLFSDRCSSTAIASDSQAVTSEISSSPAGMSSPLEVDVRNGSSPGEPSPKVPSYVRLSASASGYGGNSSYSSLPRLGKSRQPLSISNSPPRDVLPTGRQANGGDIYLLNIDASANTGGEGRTVDGGKENGPYVSHDELGQSMSDRLVKSSVNSASENVVVTSSTSDKNCTRERGRPSSIVIQNERSRPSSTLVKSERSRPSSTVEQNGSSTEEAMLDNTRVEDVTLVADNISEATAYTDLHGSLEKDGHYYLKLVELEKSSLDGLCRLAQEDISRDLPEEILGKLWSAIGKATLLTTKKFKQCRELCYQNINGPEPDHPVTLSSDLEGYWELVSIQLKEVHDTFAEIDKLRQNNWIDDTPPPQPPYISPPTSPVRKTPAKKAVSARVKLPPRQPIQKRIQAARMNSANNAAARRAAAVNEDNRLTDKQQSNLEVVLPAGGLQLDSPSLFPSAIANETDNYNASSSEDVIAEELNSNSRALVDVTISGGVS